MKDWKKELIEKSYGTVSPFDGKDTVLLAWEIDKLYEYIQQLLKEQIAKYQRREDEHCRQLDEYKKVVEAAKKYVEVWTKETYWGLHYVLKELEE